MLFRALIMFILRRMVLVFNSIRGISSLRLNVVSSTIPFWAPSSAGSVQWSFCCRFALMKEKVHERKCPYYMLHRYCAVCSRTWEHGRPLNKMQLSIFIFFEQTQENGGIQGLMRLISPGDARDEMIASFLPSPGPTQSEPPRRIRCWKTNKRTRTWRSGTKENFFLCSSPRELHRNAFLLISSTEAFNLKTFCLVPPGNSIYPPKKATAFVSCARVVLAEIRNGIMEFLRS